MKHLDWSKLSSSKQQNLIAQKSILILGTRDLSAQRIASLAKLADKSLLIFGHLKEDFISGFEDCPQFSSLKLAKLKASLESLPEKNATRSATKTTQAKKHQNISILTYRQTEAKYLLRELNLQAVLIVRGSYQYAFHYTPLFYEINKRNLKYKLLSPFNSQSEAKNYETQIKKSFGGLNAKSGKKCSDDKLMNLANQAGKFSFDYTFQTGAVLAKDNHFLLASHNTVVPFETAMLHFGSSKETHFGPPQDLNFYDTNHAEVELILQAQQQQLDLTGTTLYINLMPCPICARMLARSPIAEIVYQLDHSDGYAFKLLKQAGKKIRRV